MAASVASTSDYVRDTRLRTTVSPGLTHHTYYVSSPNARSRRARVEETWRRQHQLGNGTFGRVWLETCESEAKRGQLRAVKEVTKSLGSASSIDYGRELEAMAKFSHDNYVHCFVRFFGWYESRETVFIAMEYFEHGDLEKHLKSPFPEADARKVSQQLAEGLSFMHENSFVHRDLKPLNILVVHPGPDWWVKIGDFGISKRVADGTALRTRVGSPGYTAPEVIGIFSLSEQRLSSNERRSDIYSASVDIWALGEITVRMLGQCSAFPEPTDLFNYVVRGDPFPRHILEGRDVSDDCYDFIEKTMAPAPSQRLQAREAVKHPWLQESRPSSRSSSHHSFVDASSFNSTNVSAQSTSTFDPATLASLQWSTVEDVGASRSADTIRPEATATWASEMGARISTPVKLDASSHRTTVQQTAKPKVDGNDDIASESSRLALARANVPQGAESRRQIRPRILGFGEVHRSPDANLSQGTTLRVSDTPRPFGFGEEEPDVHHNPSQSPESRTREASRVAGSHEAEHSTHRGVNKRIPTGAVFNRWRDSLSPILDTKLHYTGLANRRGDRSQVNSILQCLFASPGFGTELSDHRVPDRYSIPRTRDETADGPQLVLRAMSHLFCWMKSGEYETLTADSLIDNLRAASPNPSGIAQLDAHEFMSMVFANLNHETNPRRHQPASMGRANILTDPDLTEMPGTRPGMLLREADEFWHEFAATHGRSIVGKYWQGLLVKTLQCNECGFKHHAFSPFASIRGLNCTTNAAVPLRDAVQASLSPIRIKGFVCSECNRTTPATMVAAFGQLPKLLRVDLRLYDESGREPRECGPSVSVTWPLNDFDMTSFCIPRPGKQSPFVTSPPDSRYKTYAIVVREGRPSEMGYYSAYVRNFSSHDPLAWYYCHDDKVTSVRLGGGGRADVSGELWRPDKKRAPVLAFFQRKDWVPSVEIDSMPPLT